MSVRAMYATAKCGKCQLSPVAHTIAGPATHAFVFQGDKK